MEIHISPLDLFFMAKALGGYQIDYDYVALVEDISKDYEVKQAESLSALSLIGLIKEDFDGSSPTDDAKVIFEPVFNGNKIVTVSVFDMQSQQMEINYKFHFKNESVTSINLVGETLGVSGSSIGIISDLISRLFDEYRNEGKASLKVSDVTEQQIRKVFVLKKNVIGTTSSVLPIYDIEGCLYLAQDEETLNNILGEEAESSFRKIVMED